MSDPARPDSDRPTGIPALRGLLLAEFLGAFNDHAWKMVVALLSMRAATAGLTAGTPAFEAASQYQATVAFVVYTLPLAVFSLPAGPVADRFSKRSVIVWLKMFEVLVLLLGTLSLALGGPVWPLFLTLGLMSFQSALYSPSKYGIIPELVPHEKLAHANGLLEMWTFLAIIAGTGLGGLLLDLSGTSPWIAGIVLTLCALGGWAASLTIPDVNPATAEPVGVIESVRDAWAILSADRVLRLSVMGSILFWGIVSLLGQDILVYAKAITAGNAHSDSLSGLPMALYGVGVAAGSMLAARLSGQMVEYGLIPLGSLGIALFTLVFGIFGPGIAGTLFVMLLLGLSSGLILVPLDSIMQWRSPAHRRGAVIALANVFVFGGTVAGSLGAGLLAGTGLDARQIILATAVLTTGGTLWALWLLPDFLLRLVIVISTNIFYRLTIVGGTHVPQQGGALLVSNHVSFIDGFLVIASTDRPVRFIVDELYYHHWLLNPFMRALHVIPVSSTGGLRVVLKALRDAGSALDEGELVCIFPEGEVTRTGMMLPFRRGLERIIKGRSAPIIPIHLDRVWGSVYSRSGGRFLTKMPERYPHPVTVSFGTPLPAETRVAHVRQIIMEMGSAAWDHRRADARPLHHHAIRMLRTRPWRFIAGDQSTWHVSRLEALASIIALARALRPHWEGQTHVGLLLPTTIPGAWANVAAALGGRVSVNLNWTAGPAGMASAARQAGLRSVLTSRAFLEKASLTLPEGVTPLYLEDIAAGITRAARLSALLLAVTAPIRLLERLAGASATPDIDDIATIIFSSGSTGEPKGVMLSHWNIGSNVEGVAQVLSVDGSDRLLGALPLFHSFGTMSMWFALRTGMGLVFHPNPLDSVAIGGLVEKFGATMLIATPTFLQIYMRRCTPGQFGSLRIVLTGAERLPSKVADAFEEKFGIRPIEGYGATECAPAITVSTLDFRGRGIYQYGSRRGFVGHPVPGLSVRIVDPDTGTPIPHGTPGMLLVRGPNVMRGYIGRDDLTAKALRDGWYVTGDIAVMDENGFIRITDRLSRFSKIGGEMVPHGKVEEALQQASGLDVMAFAVTAIPDERKGERLAVLHTLDESRIPELLERLATAGLPNLFIPRRDSFVRVDKLPLLGTGKLDLRGIRQTALDALAKSPAA
ncbi:MAG TPA: acyl-[ACP]--phospholipid O-acyltransferase [Candidatus Ozemobacteraceae bacterium]|nr:acyl-[ACP]--phospholipid O-acyltransferase [Candidatus Ozemobacteraceae bacterium]